MDTKHKIIVLGGGGLLAAFLLFSLFGKKSGGTNNSVDMAAMQNDTLQEVNKMVTSVSDSFGKQLDSNTAAQKKVTDSLALMLSGYQDATGRQLTVLSNDFTKQMGATNKLISDNQTGMQTLFASLSRSDADIYSFIERNNSQTSGLISELLSKMATPNNYPANPSPVPSAVSSPVSSPSTASGSNVISYPSPSPTPAPQPSSVPASTQAKSGGVSLGGHFWEVDSHGNIFKDNSYVAVTSKTSAYIPDSVKNASKSAKAG